MNDEQVLAWEAAYLRFETAEEEIAKFRRRLSGFGVNRWDRDLRILELFCGRGNGLHAWAELGFRKAVGMDLSADLVAKVDRKFQTIVGDAREVPLNDASIDVISIQGGLHHLADIPQDLERVLVECRRVLSPGGRLVIVEPWLTPFLVCVHFCCRQRLLRSMWSKLDALATMIELERETYFSWLEKPRTIEETILRIFPGAIRRRSFGKWYCLAELS